MKKQTKTVLSVLGIIALIILLAVFFNRSLSIIGGLDIQTQNTTWQTMPITLTSVYFGSLNSGDKVNISGYNTADICDKNDAGVISLSNGYTAADTLSLSSSLSSGGRDCSGNFINAQLTAHAGTLTVTCTTSASTQSRAGESSGSCTINEIQSLSHACYDDYGCPRFSQSNQQTFVINTTEGQNVDISLETKAAYQGNGKANLVITFTSTPKVYQTQPQPNPTPTPTPEENITLIDIFFTPENQTVVVNGSQVVQQVNKAKPIFFVAIWGSILGVIVVILLVRFIVRRRR